MMKVLSFMTALLLAACVVDDELATVDQPGGGRLDGCVLALDDDGAPVFRCESPNRWNGCRLVIEEGEITVRCER
jgi:hypothetical protein